MSHFFFAIQHAHVALKHFITRCAAAFAARAKPEPSK